MWLSSTISECLLTNRKGVKRLVIINDQFSKEKKRWYLENICY